MSDLNAYASQALALVEEKLDARQKRVIDAICRAFGAEENSGAIDPNVAVQFCMKLADIRELRLSLINAERAHVAERSRNAKILDSS